MTAPDVSTGHGQHSLREAVPDLLTAASIATAGARHAVTDDGEKAKACIVVAHSYLAQVLERLDLARVPDAETPPRASEHTQGDALFAAGILVSKVAGKAALVITSVAPEFLDTAGSRAEVRIATNFGRREDQALEGLKVLAEMFGCTPTDQWAGLDDDGEVCPEITFDFEGVRFRADAHIRDPATVAETRSWIAEAAT